MIGDLLDFRGRRRLPSILQTEAAECGLACLAMVASYHGHRIDLNTLRRFISDRGKTRSRRVTGLSRRHQQQLSLSVKRARELALLPYVGER